MDLNYNSFEDSDNSYTTKGDLSISDTLLDFERLRISALTKAAEISPLVKQVTIGPKSPVKKDYYKENVSHENNNTTKDIDENLIEDKFSDDLRHTLIMKDHETKLQETSTELFKNFIGKIIFNRADTMRKYFNKQSEQFERQAIEIKMRKLAMLKQYQQNDNLLLLEKAKADEKHSQMINKQTIENMNRILEEQNKATARFASVTDSHTKICICYNDISSIFQTESNTKQIGHKYITSVNAVMTNIGKIIELCKTGAITDKEVKQAEVLSLNIENIKKNLLEDINNINEELVRQEEEAKTEQLKQKKADEMKAEMALTEKPLLESTTRIQPQFYSPKNYSYYEELKNYLNNYEKKYKNLLENVNLKKFRFDCQKAVNTPVNAISSVSGIHMRDKFDKLSQLLRGEKVQVLDTYVTVSQHPEGVFYCTALLAKKIVRQGDLLVSSKPESAFPLASITVALCAQFPEFSKLLEGYFHAFCPYLVPMFLPQKEGQTDKDFYLSRGYTYNDEGTVEKHDKFLKRMSGLFRLKCAIWITTAPRFVNASNPHGLRFGWDWLASFLNLKPEPDICATLLHDFFIVCGSTFLKHYGVQFTKIIKLICTDYFAILENIDEGGPKTRLEVFLQNVLRNGHISPPSGFLQPNTW